MTFICWINNFSDCLNMFNVCVLEKEEYWYKSCVVFFIKQATGHTSGQAKKGTKSKIIHLCYIQYFTCVFTNPTCILFILLHRNNDKIAILVFLCVKMQLFYFYLLCNRCTCFSEKITIDYWCSLMLCI